MASMQIQTAICVLLLFLFMPNSGAVANKNSDVTFMDNSTTPNNRTNYGRLFQFSKGPSSIEVELAFAIPFLSIPVTRSKEGTKGKNYLADFNIEALATGGLFTVASLIFIPKLFDSFKTHLSFGRSEGDEHSRGLTGMLSRLDDTLMDYNIDSASCTQRAVCWMVNSAVDNVNGGKGKSMDKIVDGIISNSWLQKMVNGTGIQESIENGKKGRNCSLIYSRCPLTQERLQLLAKYFSPGIK